MPEVVPPRPKPPARRLGALATLRRGRESLLGLLYADQYEREFFATRLLARRVFVCNSPATVREAFLGNAAALGRKSPQMRHALGPLLGDGLFVSEGEVWRARRPPVAAATHASRLAELVPVMTEVAEEWRAAWEGRRGEAVDVLAEMAELAAEVICRALFGRALGSAARREVVAAFTAYQAKVASVDLPSLLGLPDRFPRFGRVGAEARRIQAVVGDLVDAVLAGRGEGGLLAAMSHAMGREALRNEAATLFMAGHETTANALAWAWWLLAEDPASAARLRAEAAGALGGRVPGFDDLRALPFARAVVEETLRLYPPVPFLAREAVEGLSLRGQRVPRGSLVVVCPWLLHRHRRFWDAPDAFRPDRFLPPNPPPDRALYLPFSFGPRVCTGVHFGLAEAVVVLAGLAPRFAPAKLPGHDAFPVARLTTRPGATLLMRLDRPPGESA